jgi:hypothetical protein
MTPSQLPRHPCVKLACMGLFDEAFDVSLLQFASSAIWFAAALARPRCPGCDKSEQSASATSYMRSTSVILRLVFVQNVA